MAWLLLLAAAALEVTWALALKEADGFSRAGPAALGVITAVASVALLVLALRDLPVGTAYAVWTGLGAVGVALAGIVLLGESASAARLGCLVLVAAGVAGLRLLE
ncbi:MAG TPA: multidrug efflux SMR transporter [Solirubrobacteraceae bacterium]|nr:multidrug efflux SMR transporter [Solirubrobacteraceae bacterium]